MKLTKLAVILIALFFTGSAYADPGIGIWLNSRSVEVFEVGSGSKVTYSFTTDVHSKPIYVSSTADLCFDTDTTSATVGDARITVRRSVGSALDVSSITLIIPFNLADCVELVTGQYWVDVTIARTASETPIVIIRGR